MEKHIVVPVYKSGDKTSVKNYRPISILSNIGKVLERVIFNKVINIVTDKLTLSQFGAIKGRSPLQQLLLFLDNIYSSNSQTDVIYLDIRKVFDTISHSKLLLRLHSLGIQGNLWQWLKWYLSNRIQCVRINGTLSTFLLVYSGVPQGSILGPLLFLIYINDFPLYLRSSKCFLFFDDTKVFKRINQQEDTIHLQLNLDFLIQI